MGTAGCGGSSAPAHEPASQSAAPRRIVSLSPALTEILFAVGLGERVVGVTDYCDFPPEARSRRKVGGYANPSVEAILALSPDVVLVSPGPGNRDAALAVGRAGVRVEVVPSETLDEAIAAIEEVGRRCGAEDRARSLAKEVRSRLDATTARVASARRVRTLFCVQTDPLIVAGRGTLPSQLLELAGGVNVVEAERYPRIGMETVLAGAPEVILQSRMDAPASADPPTEGEFWKRWPDVPAVRAGRVVVLAGDAALRPGPRVAEAVEELARLLHPEIVAEGRRP